MNKKSTSAKLVFAIMLTLLPALAFAQHAVPYEPLAGDLVVTFTHRFKPADYVKGREMLEQHFGAPITEKGKDRRTFFLENKASSEILVVSFFHSDPLIEHWNDTPEQTAILQQLEPMHSEPVTMQKYILGLH